MPRPAIKKTPYKKATRRRRPYSGPLAIARASLRPEMKSYDYYDASSRALKLVAAVAGATTMTTGMTAVNIMQGGTTFFSRVGSKYALMSLACECDFSLAQTDASAASIRIMLVYDRQVNGAYPLIDDVLYDNENAVTFNSAIRIANRDRFAVLRDTQTTLDIGSGTARHYETYIKRRLNVSFKASSANNAIADINVGAIYLMAFYVQLYGTTVPTISSVHCRTRYIDA